MAAYVPMSRRTQREIEEDADNLMIFQRRVHDKASWGEHGAGTMEQCQAQMCRSVIWLYGVAVLRTLDPKRS